MIDNILIESLEKERLELYNKFKKELNLFILKLISSIIGIIIGIFIPILALTIIVIGLSGLFLIYNLVILYLEYKKRTPLINKVKDNIISELTSYLYENSVYDRTSGILESVVFSTKTTPTSSTKYHSEDYIKGKYNNVTFEASDVNVQVWQSSGKSGSYVNYFLGKWIIFPLEKNYNHTIKILSNSSRTNNKALIRVKTENVQFDKRYKTYSTSNSFAKQILTNEMMDILMELFYSYKGNIIFYLENDKLHLGINDSKNNLEFVLKIPIELQIPKILEELSLFKNIIEKLKININF